MADFFQTMMGRKFFDGTAPRIADALESIAKELKRQNDLKEKPNEQVDVKGIAGEFIKGDE